MTIIKRLLTTTFTVLCSMLGVSSRTAMTSNSKRIDLAGAIEISGTGFGVELIAMLVDN